MASKSSIINHTYELKQLNASHVIYIETGGRKLGMSIARSLDIPCSALDIRYPISRTIEKSPFLLKPFLWLVKEFIYKTTQPIALCEDPVFTDLNTPIILADDSASSGKTLKIALKILQNKNIERHELFTVVNRCGKKAKPLVDFIVL